MKIILDFLKPENKHSLLTNKTDSKIKIADKGLPYYRDWNVVMRKNIQ